MELAQQTPDTPLLFSVAEAARRLGISRSKLYELVAAREVGSVKLGGRRLVPSALLAEYVEQLIALQSEDSD